MRKVLVRFRGGKTHTVEAEGGPKDGSLYGLYTDCGRCIIDIDKVEEVTGAHPTCRVCLRCQEAPRATTTEIQS